MIEWTDETWNPVTGCTKVSAGCKNCYAERLFPRPYPGRAFTDVQIHTERLKKPFHWRKPRRVFVNSMSDLFHEAVPDEFLDQVFAVMAITLTHTYQVLTKRPERMCAYCADDATLGRVLALMAKWTAGVPEVESTVKHRADGLSGFQLPNVWLGVSVEDQEAADARIPLLLETPAAVRFLSCEPLLGRIDLRLDQYKRLDWVIVGGESGPRARSMDLDWAHSLVEQCDNANVACFVKQLGSNFQPKLRDKKGVGEMIKVNGARIVQAMVEHNMGVRVLCVTAAVDNRTLKKALDEGQMIRISSLSRIAHALNIPVVELIINAPTSIQEKDEPDVLHQGRGQPDLLEDSEKGVRRSVVRSIHSKEARHL